MCTYDVPNGILEFTGTPTEAEDSEISQSVTRGLEEVGHQGRAAHGSELIKSALVRLIRVTNIR
jgi:hypothetical protein